MHAPGAELHPLDPAALRRDRNVRVLMALDSLVARDSAPPGISGVLALGVKPDRFDEVWWIVRMANQARTEFALRPPKDADLCLALGSGAAALFGGEAPDRAGGLWVAGDTSLLDAFVQRYLEKSDVLALRCAAASRPRKRVRR